MAFKTESAAPGINLVKNVTANQTPGQKFFEKMLCPAEVQKFAKQNPEAFKSIMHRMSVFMGFSVNTKEPLGESINAKTGALTIVGNGGEFTMPNAAKILTPAQLRAENPLLVINPFICLIGKDGVSISGEFSGEMRQFLRLYENMPSSDGWYAQVDGVPKGTSSHRSDEQALYLALLSAFGSLWRGYYDYRFDNYRRVVDVGNGLRCSGGVLIQTSQAPKLVSMVGQKANTLAGSSASVFSSSSVLSDQEAYAQQSYLMCNGLQQ